MNHPQLNLAIEKTKYPLKSNQIVNTCPYNECDGSGWRLRVIGKEGIKEVCRCNTLKWPNNNFYNIVTSYKTII